MGRSILSISVSNQWSILFYCVEFESVRNFVKKTGGKRVFEGWGVEGEEVKFRVNFPPQNNMFEPAIGCRTLLSFE